MNEIEQDNMDIQIPPSKTIIDNLITYSKNGENWVELLFPVFTTSEANGGVKKCKIINGRETYKSDHWTDRYRRKKNQKNTVGFYLIPFKHILKMPCKISFTRYAPGKLDRFDNLPMSLKYILDAICEIITNDYRPGRADGHEGLEVTYSQELCKKYFVKVRIENL